MLSNYVSTYEHNWAIYLPKDLMADSSSSCESTGFTNFVLFESEIVFSVEIVADTPPVRINLSRGMLYIGFKDLFSGMQHMSKKLKA